MALWSQNSHVSGNFDGAESESTEAGQPEASGWSGSRRAVGVDLGYGYVKMVEGQEEYSFPSVVGLGQPLKYQLDLRPRQEGNGRKEILDNLVVWLDSRCYFVGQLAVRQSDIAARSLYQDRVADKNVKILLASALGLLAQRENQTFSLVTGLPSNYYRSYQEEWCDSLKGQYAVKFGGSPGERLKTFAVRDVRAVPQPFGTLYDQALNNFGKVANRELSELVVGIVDVGFKTTDFAAANRMEFIDHLSYSTTTALSSAYRMVADRLRDEMRLEKENYELDEIIQRGAVRVAGKTTDISQMKREAFERVAQKIVNEMCSLWDYRSFDVIFLTGGGGSALADFLRPQFPNMVLVEGPQYANVRGFQKLANYLHSNSED